MLPGIPSFDAEFDRDNSDAPASSYLICSVPRCGSTLLCHGLWRTALAGFPAEYFNPRHYFGLLRRWRCHSFGSHLKSWRCRSGLLGDSPELLQRYATALARHRAGENGVLGIKLHFSHWREQLQLRPLDSFLPPIKYVRITREDKVRQAVSYSRARQTDQYRYTPGASDNAQYSFEDIAACLRQMRQEEDGWSRLFGSRGISAVEITYEQLAGSYADTVARVVRQVCGSAPRELHVPAPELRKQSDERTEQWIDRFHGELAVRDGRAA